MKENKLDKLQKSLGKSTIDDLNNKSPVDLKNTIVDAESSMKAAKEELESNPRYEAMKESLSDLSAGMKEVNKRQRAIIQYSLYRLEESGKQS